MTDYLCMSPEELALWQTPNSYVRTSRPCIDCPIAFHLAEKAAGRCLSVPGFQGGRKPSGRTPPEVLIQWREASRRHRAKASQSEGRQRCRP